jgi:hypothetical protein
MRISASPRGSKVSSTSETSGGGSANSRSQARNSSTTLVAGRWSTSDSTSSPAGNSPVPVPFATHKMRRAPAARNRFTRGVKPASGAPASTKSRPRTRSATRPFHPSTTPPIPRAYGCPMRR